MDLVARTVQTEQDLIDGDEHLIIEQNAVDCFEGIRRRWVDWLLDSLEWVGFADC